MERAPIPTRVSLVEQRLEGQGAEVQRLRERMHRLEGDRAALRHAVAAMHELRRDVPRIAEAAAVRALSKHDHERDERRRVNLRDVIVVISCLLAVSAFLIDHLL